MEQVVKKPIVEPGVIEIEYLYSTKHFLDKYRYSQRNPLTIQM